MKELQSTFNVKYSEPKQKELDKIAMENNHLKNKIETMRSVYSIDQFNNHNSRRRELLGLRCEYPVIIEKGYQGNKPEDKSVGEPSPRRPEGSTRGAR